MSASNLTFGKPKYYVHSSCINLGSCDMSAHVGPSLPNGCFEGFGHGGWPYDEHVTKVRPVRLSPGPWVKTVGGRSSFTTAFLSRVAIDIEVQIILCCAGVVLGIIRCLIASVASTH